MKNFCFALSITFIFNANHVFGAEVGMPQLNPEYWAAQIFWLILIFSGLYLIIWKIFFPRITDSIENRKSKVINDLAETQKIKEIEKELLNVEKEIKSLKKSSISSINKIAVETSAEMIRKIVGGDVNLSNVSDIIEDISKEKVEKNI